MYKFFILVFFLAGSGLTAYAQSTPILNAGLVSDIWYSSSSVTEGDIIKIYSGVYNSSQSKVTGMVTYFVDAIEVGKTTFSSEPKSLIQIETGWTATAGDHKVKVKISTSTANLAQIESNEEWLSVQKKITKESVQKDVQSVVKKAVATIDPIAEKIADNIDGLKDKLGVDTVVGNSTSTDRDKRKITDSDLSKVNKIKNKVLGGLIDGSSYIVRHWIWSIPVIILLYFIIRRRREKKSWW